MGGYPLKGLYWVYQLREQLVFDRNYQFNVGIGKWGQNLGIGVVNPCFCEIKIFEQIDYLLGWQQIITHSTIVYSE
jgi:hypothetical protein